MKKMADYIVKHKKIIVILSVLLLIPAFIGMHKTKINYDILVYLPKDIETIKGQNILTDDFNTGAFAITVVDNMTSKDILKLEKNIKEIDGVNKTISIEDITGTTIPVEFLPNDIVNRVKNKNSQIILVTFDKSTSDDKTLEAVENMREIVKDKAQIGGMSAMVLDTKQLFNSEMALYVAIAVLLCIIVLMFSLDSYLVPLLLLANIGVAILYNMGTNILLGDISYITKAISAVLQLGVTTDFSIFLYHKYEKAKKDNKDKNKAMSGAICDTLVSVFGSSLTTIAGFLALVTMNLTLGADIGIVMSKGVLLGLLCVITLFPSLLLMFDKQIEKTKHKELLPKFTHIKKFVLKNYKIIFVVFLLLLFPAYKAQTKSQVYYKLDESIPQDYGYSIATKTLKKDFNIVSQEMILVNADMPDALLNAMVNDLKSVDGINLVLSASSLKDIGLSEDMLSDDLKEIYKTDEYKLILVNSTYDIATKELNEQIKEVNDIVKSYDKNIIVAGEGPLMKDLVEITDEDFKNVNITSIGVIFVLMLIVLKSISLPIILVSAIEFAIFLNMGVPYFTGTEIPFIASVVIGTIQLGATIDYAILMTTKYLEERKSGKKKEDAVKSALDNSITSIIVSGLCFFAATIGVGIISKVDMIGSLCTLISRGAIISMIVVILIVPSLLMIFDKLIINTTMGFKDIKKGNKSMKKNIKKLAAYTLIGLLTFSSMPVYALTKEETVYSKLDTDGKTKYTIVTEHLINDEKKDTIIDSTDLKDIINTNGEEKYELKDNKITWQANKNDIYYKGNTDKKLPIELNVTYKLNGKESNLKDMLGKSGKVEIKLNYKNNDKHIVKVNGKNTTMYTPFVVATSTIFDSTTTSNLSVDNGKIVSNGKNYALAGIASPGLYESLNLEELKGLDTITIKYDTTNFELNSIYSVVTSKILDSTDLKVFNSIDSLYNKVDTLKESSSKLVNGSKTLSDGTKQIRTAVIKAISTLKNNNETIDENTLNYIKTQASNEAIKKVENNKDSIMQQAEKELLELEEKTHQIKTASDMGIDNDANLQNTLKLAAKSQLQVIMMQTQQMDENTFRTFLTTPEGAETLKQAEQKAVNDAKSKMYKQALELAKQTAGLTAYNTALQTAKETSNEVAVQVAVTVAKTVKDTVINKVVSSLNTLVGGLDILVDGADTLNDGMTKFDNEGINKIASFVNSTVKPSSEKIKELTKLANNYNTFTKKSNNENSNTKFILVIDSEKKQEKNKTIKKEENKETFTDKIKNLFK